MFSSMCLQRCCVRLLSPAVTCADEVDGLLGTRGMEEITALKTEFLQRWDGLLTDQGVRHN